MMFKPTHKKNKSKINIIPMIDVIFFLLVFFMLFTTFRSNPYGIEMQLPQAVTVERQDEEHMLVNINKEGEFYYDGELLPVQKIGEIAGDYYQDNNDLLVIINADQETMYSSIILLMDNLREKGIYNLALAAERDQDD